MLESTLRQMYSVAASWHYTTYAIAILRLPNTSYAHNLFQSSLPYSARESSIERAHKACTYDIKCTVLCSSTYAQASQDRATTFMLKSDSGWRRRQGREAWTTSLGYPCHEYLLSFRHDKGRRHQVDIDRASAALRIAWRKLESRRPGSLGARTECVDSRLPNINEYLAGTQRRHSTVG